MKADLMTLDGKKSDQIDLPIIFNTELNSKLMYALWIKFEFSFVSNTFGKSIFSDFLPSSVNTSTFIKLQPLKHLA